MARTMVALQKEISECVVSRDTEDPVQTGLRSHALHCLQALVALRVVSPEVVRPRSTVIGHVVRDRRIRYTIML